MKKALRYSAIAGVLLFLFLGFMFLHQSGLFSMENIEKLQMFIDSFGIWAPVVYGLIYICVTLFGISAAFFTVLAGTLFGLWKGFFIVLISATTAAMIAFYIARYFRERVIGVENKRKQRGEIRRLVEKIEEQAERRGFYIIAILRLSFLPYIPLSYAAGLVEKLKARDFFLATFLTNIFGSFVFIFLGASLMQNLWLFIIAIILVLLFMQLPKLIKRFNRNGN